MNFTYTFSREYLQGLPEKRRLDSIKNLVDQYVVAITREAELGKTSYLVNYIANDPHKGCAKTYPPPYIPTLEDMIEGFMIKFPGCKVGYTETWQETRPGVKEQKKGILIDWS